MKRLLILSAIALVLTAAWFHLAGFGHDEKELVYRNDAGQVVGHPHFDMTVETIHDAGKCNFIVFAEEDPAVEGPPCVEWRQYFDDEMGGYWMRYRGPASAMPRGAVLIGDLP